MCAPRLTAKVAFRIIRGGLRLEAPSVEVDRIERDAEEIGGNESELSGTDADDTHDGAIDGGDDQPCQSFLPSRIVPRMVRTQEM